MSAVPPVPPPLPQVQEGELGYILVTITMRISIGPMYSREDAANDLKQLKEDVTTLDPSASFTTNLSDSLKELTL